MRVIRSAGENVSPSDDGRLYDQIFTDGLFNDTTFVNLGGNNIQCGSMYGDLCGRDFTIEQMVIAATLPEGEGETTGCIYVEIDTASDDVITLNTALAPFTPTYENINTNGAIAQMIVAEYTATAVAVQSVTPVYKIVSAGSVLPGSVATVEVSPATQNHSVGEFILYGGQLYSVTSAITAGQSLTPGTNISATSAGDELSSLKAGLTNSTTYTTTETVVGTWTDGRPIYRKVYTGLNFGGTTGAWTNTGASVTNFRQVVNAYALSGSNLVPMLGFRILNGAIQYFANNTWGGTDKVVLEYTKTTD